HGRGRGRKLGGRRDRRALREAWRRGVRLHADRVAEEEGLGALLRPEGKRQQRCGKGREPTQVHVGSPRGWSFVRYDAGVMQCTRCHREIEPSFKACPHCGEAVTDFARRYSGELLDNKYRIVERLGTGGMGEVYKATHTYLDADRVIKIVRSSIAGSDEAHD